MYSLVILMHIYSVFLDIIHPSFSSNSFHTPFYTPLPSLYPFIYTQRLISVILTYMDVGPSTGVWARAPYYGLHFEETDFFSPSSHSSSRDEPLPFHAEMFSGLVLDRSCEGVLFSFLLLWQILKKESVHFPSQFQIIAHHLWKSS